MARFRDEVDISIHALREEGDVRRVEIGAEIYIISIHALREEGDLGDKVIIGDAVHFYPRPPRGGQPFNIVFNIPTLLFLSTPSARRATKRPKKSGTNSRYFYPRPPRGGRRLILHNRSGFSAFLSTPSARRATSWPAILPGGALHFYPRPPRGGRLKL